MTACCFMDGLQPTKIDRQKKNLSEPHGKCASNIWIACRDALSTQTHGVVQFERAFEAWAGTHPSADRNAELEQSVTKPLAIDLFCGLGAGPGLLAKAMR